MSDFKITPELVEHTSNVLKYNTENYQPFLDEIEQFKKDNKKALDAGYRMAVEIFTRDPQPTSSPTFQKITLETIEEKEIRERFSRQSRLNLILIQALDSLEKELLRVGIPNFIGTITANSGEFSVKVTDLDGSVVSFYENDRLDDEGDFAN